MNVTSTVYWIKCQVHYCFCIRPIDRLGEEDCCPQAVTVVKIVFGKGMTAPHAVYAKLRSERSLFQVQLGEWWLMNFSSSVPEIFLLILHIISAMANVPVVWMHSLLSDCCVVHKSVGVLWCGYQTPFPEYMSDIFITEAIHKKHI